MNAKREARFYAWIAFDGCEYAKKINDGQPLWINFKNTNTNGWSQSNTRNCAGTGYLSKKFIDPNIRFGAMVQELIGLRVVRTSVWLNCI